MGEERTLRYNGGGEGIERGQLERAGEVAGGDLLQEELPHEAAPPFQPPNASFLLRRRCQTTWPPSFLRLLTRGTTVAQVGGEVRIAVMWSTARI